MLLSEQQVESFAKPSPLEGVARYNLFIFCFEIGLKYDESPVTVRKLLQEQTLHRVPGEGAGT